MLRPAPLASLVARPATGLRLNEHLDHHDGPLVFEHACQLGLEGIVSKRKNSRYRSGRSPDWIKSKNPNAPAVKREAEENWGRRSEPSPQPVEADTSPQKADSLDHIGDRGQNGCTHRSDTWLHPNDFAQTSDSFSLRGGRRPCTTPTGL
jgi:hypothetical protein